MVELFGGWVKYDAVENFIPAKREEADSFLETIGVETVYPQQLQLVKPAQETVGVRARLAAVLDDQDLRKGGRRKKEVSLKLEG